MKKYNVMKNIGKAKYVVSFHDGVKTYEDGSDFYDIMIFCNKRKLNKFISGLRKEGYIERN